MEGWSFLCLGKLENQPNGNSRTTNDDVESIVHSIDLYDDEADGIEHEG